MKLRVAHLYPREMNLYGDTGNVMTIRRRLSWRDHSCEVLPVEVGEPFDFGRADLVIGGGGPEAAQTRVAGDLLLRRDDIRAAVDAGIPMLVVCGLYQLFGTGFATTDGLVLPGIGVFDACTTQGQRRVTGDLVVASEFGRLVGYENHAGQTTLGESQRPLGRVLAGTGNAPSTRTEGAVTGSAIGTYLHGPVLPRNPGLADWLILRALRRHDGSAELPCAPEEDTAGRRRAPRMHLSRRAVAVQPSRVVR